jgi:hypothetical protein
MSMDVYLKKIEDVHCKGRFQFAGGVEKRTTKNKKTYPLVDKSVDNV